METIKNYLSNMFASLPDTAELRKIREDLCSDMEEKYQELKKQGRSENESIGIVISEFGNIEELVKELGYNMEQAAVDDVRCLDEEEVREILSVKNRWHQSIAAGVLLCILSPVVFMFTEAITESDALMTLAFFMMIAVAVGLFVIAGMHLSKYKFLEKEVFEIPVSVTKFLEREKEAFRGKYILSITIGVILCILSPILFMGVDEMARGDMKEEISTLLMFSCIGIAVTLFIIAGNRMGTFRQLLQEGEYNVKTKQNKSISIATVIVWPLAVIIYLLWSFTTGDWDKTWVIWPVTAVIFWMFTAVMSIVQEQHEK